MPRSASETDGNYCVPTSAGNKALRSNTIGTGDCSRLRKGLCQGEFFFCLLLLEWMFPMHWEPALKLDSMLYGLEIFKSKYNV